MQLTGIPGGLATGVGDATNYIRLNPSTGLIEYGGTMRPTIQVPLFNYVWGYSGYFAPTLMGSGSKARWTMQCADADATAWLSSDIVVDPRWDLSAAATVKARLASTGATSSQSIVYTASIGWMDDGARFDTATEIAVVTATTLAMTDSALRVPNLYTIMSGIDLSGVSAGDTLSFQFGRDGADASDDLAAALIVLDVWMEVRKNRE